MRKNFIYVGIFLFLMGILVAVFSFQANIPSGAVPISSNLQLGSNSLSFLRETLNESGVLIFWFNSSSNINVFLANSTAFGTISTAGQRNISAAAQAQSLEPTNSVYLIYLNASAGVYPYLSQGSGPTPNYLANSTTLLSSGNYYVIFQNTGNKTANVSASRLTLSLTQLKSTSASLFEYSGASIALLIAGIILVIIGAVLRGKPKESEKADTEAEKEYDRIERQGKKRKKA